MEMEPKRDHSDSPKSYGQAGSRGDLTAGPLRSKPHAMHVQRRAKVTAERTASREQKLEAPSRKIPSALMNMGSVRQGGGEEC